MVTLYDRLGVYYRVSKIMRCHRAQVRYWVQKFRYGQHYHGKRHGGSKNLEKIPKDVTTSVMKVIVQILRKPQKTNLTKLRVDLCTIFGMILKLCILVFYYY
jgi:hypothetical protein